MAINPYAQTALAQIKDEAKTNPSQAKQDFGLFLATKNISDPKLVQQDAKKAGLGTDKASVSAFLTEAKSDTAALAKMTKETGSAKVHDFAMFLQTHHISNPKTDKAEAEALGKQIGLTSSQADSALGKALEPTISTAPTSKLKAPLQFSSTGDILLQSETFDPKSGLIKDVIELNPYYKEYDSWQFDVTYNQFGTQHTYTIKDSPGSGTTVTIYVDPLSYVHPELKYMGFSGRGHNQTLTDYINYRSIDKPAPKVEEKISTKGTPFFTVTKLHAGDNLVVVDDYDIVHYNQRVNQKLITYLDLNNLNLPNPRGGERLHFYEYNPITKAKTNKTIYTVPKLPATPQVSIEQKVPDPYITVKGLQQGKLLVVNDGKNQFKFNVNQYGIVYLGQKQIGEENLKTNKTLSFYEKDMQTGYKSNVTTFRVPPPSLNTTIIDLKQYPVILGRDIGKELINVSVKAKPGNTILFSYSVSNNSPNIEKTVIADKFGVAKAAFYAKPVSNLGKSLFRIVNKSIKTFYYNKGETINASFGPYFSKAQTYTIAGLQPNATVEEMYGQRIIEYGKVDSKGKISVYLNPTGTHTIRVINPNKTTFDIDINKLKIDDRFSYLGHHTPSGTYIYDKTINIPNEKIHNIFSRAASFYSASIGNNAVLKAAYQGDEFAVSKVLQGGMVSSCMRALNNYLLKYNHTYTSMSGKDIYDMFCAASTVNSYLYLQVQNKFIQMFGGTTSPNETQEYMIAYDAVLKEYGGNTTAGNISKLLQLAIAAPNFDKSKIDASLASSILMQFDPVGAANISYLLNLAATNEKQKIINIDNNDGKYHLNSVGIQQNTDILLKQLLLKIGQNSGKSNIFASKASNSTVLTSEEKTYFRTAIAMGIIGVVREIIGGIKPIVDIRKEYWEKMATDLATNLRIEESGSGGYTVQLFNGNIVSNILNMFSHLGVQKATIDLINRNTFFYQKISTMFEGLSTLVALGQVIIRPIETATGWKELDKFSKARYLIATILDLATLGNAIKSNGGTYLTNRVLTAGSIGGNLALNGILRGLKELASIPFSHLTLTPYEFINIFPTTPIFTQYDTTTNLYVATPALKGVLQTLGIVSQIANEVKGSTLALLDTYYAFKNLINHVYEKSNNGLPPQGLSFAGANAAFQLTNLITSLQLNRIALHDLGVRNSYIAQDVNKIPMRGAAIIAFLSLRAFAAFVNGYGGYINLQGLKNNEK